MLEFIDENGIVRHLGNNVPAAGLRYRWPVFGSVPTQKIIPRSRWNELVPDENDQSHPHALLDYLHDQDGIGMCNCSATAALIECVRKAAGLDHVPLSGGDLYRRISGGYDRGSLLEDGLAEAIRNGILPVSVCPYLNWRTNYGNQATRLKYRMIECAVCPSFDHFYSALIQGWFGISGVPWYDNYRVDSGGWLPSGSGNWGGHALLAYKPTRRRDRYAAWNKNSWTRGWGYNGLCAIPEPGYRGPVGGWWVGKLVVTEEGDLPRPKA